MFNKTKTVLYAFLEGIRINFIGNIPISEIFALGNLLAFRKYLKVLETIPEIQKITFTYLLLLISQIICDYVNVTPMDNYLRGSANILFGIIITLFLTELLLKKENHLIFFFIGSLIASVIFKNNDLGADFENAGDFKLYIAPIINNIVLLMSFFILDKNPRNKKIVVVIFIFYGISSIFLDYRSNGLQFLISGMLLIGVGRFNLKKMSLLIVPFILVFYLVYVLFVTQVLNGSFGGQHSIEQLSVTKNPYNPFELLYIGRVEIFVSFKIISDEPIWGHGSWAKDKTGKYFLLLDEMAHKSRSNYNPTAEERDTIIPSHSVLLGAWVYTGLLGFFAVIFQIYLVFKEALLLLTKLDKSDKFSPIILFFIVSSFWIYLFSPLQSIRRPLPIIIATIFVLSWNRKKGK